MKKAIKTALLSKGIDNKNSEIAFFGGSFTAIDRDYMISLLDATKEFICKFKGIRISTRPDCINPQIVALLKSYGVTAIELGAQSMCDDVLFFNDRGHSSEDVRNASIIIKEHGISLGLQMMTGLYKSTPEKDIYTAEEFIKLAPDTVRIYPTVTLKGTKLQELYINGEYFPETLDSAVSLCSKLLSMFEETGIKVIRLGLHSSETLEENIIAGAFHPAFRELCENKIFLDKIKEKIDKISYNRKVFNVFVSPDAVSKATGQRKNNINLLKDEGFSVKIISDNTLSGRNIKVEEG